MDSFNPCVISTLIFFLSVLTDAEAERRTRMLVGVSFAVVFVCFHRCMQLNALIEWSKRNLVFAKILLGIFFASMAFLMLWPK